MQHPWDFQPSNHTVRPTSLVSKRSFDWLWSAIAGDTKGVTGGAKDRRNMSAIASIYLSGQFSLTLME